LWNRVHRGWRPWLVAYVLVMAFTLVYTAEHYVVDILLGWALAAVVIAVTDRFQSRRRALAPSKAGDPLNSVPAAVPGRE
jgi:membrane-associated phospholipid phosphatase